MKELPHETSLRIFMGQLLYLCHIEELEDF